MEEFVSRFNHRGAAEQGWLQEVYGTVCHTLLPLAAPGVSVERLADAVVERVRTVTSSSQSLPVSYRCVCVSELICRQRTPCFSSLTWSTNQYREWAKEAEQVLPNHKALPRTSLLLIGFLCDGRSSGQCDGFWRVRDATGSVRCEILKSSPLWLGTLMLFPTWNYIPQDAPGPGKKAEGFLELIGSPICVTPEPTVFDSGGTLGEVTGVKKMAKLLRQRGSGGMCVCVCGEVSVVCPLLVIGGKSFFCFVLVEEDVSVPVLVTDPACVYWRQCVCVAQCVCVSALRVCSVRGWAGHRVLSVTPQSRLHSCPRARDPGDTHTHSQTGTHSNTHTSSNKPTQENTHTPSGSDSHSQLIVGTHNLDTPPKRDTPPEQDTPPERDTHLMRDTPLEQDTPLERDTPLQRDSEEGVVQVDVGPAHPVYPVRRKLSKIISYWGRITSVLNEEAGLYEIDGKVGLCLAYQPPKNWGGGVLRPGAEIEVHNVHFLFRPSPFGPDVLLCSCLRSSISVMSFSPLSSKVTSMRSDSPLLCYLLERNLDVSEYLWLSYCYTALRSRFSPRWVCSERVCVVAGRVLQCVLQHDEEREEKRDIYKEMLQDPHTCPLSQYRVNSPSVALWSVRELCDWMETESWACLSLSSLLPSSAPYLTRAELNPLLSWSAHVTTLQGRSRSVLLVGVVQLSSSRAALKLVDQTAAVDCVCVKAQTEDQNTTISTSWIGCLVCVPVCTLVMERFMKTDFPSWKHLDQPRYITHRHSRVYIQVCVDDLHILSPSAAMTTVLRDGVREEGMKDGERSCPPERRGGTGGAGGGMESAGSGSDDSSGELHPPGQRKRRREEEEEERNAGDPSDLSRHGNDPRADESSPVPFDPCVSLLFRLDMKQGVAFRNVQMSNEAQGLALSFVAKATCLGNAQRWDTDPRNRRVEERERGGVTEMELQFVDSCVRWFPLLQPGSVYRLTVRHTQDVSVLSGRSVPVKGGVTLLSSPSLFIQPEWRIHTVTPSSTAQPHIPGLMTVSQVLSSSCASDIVSFYGVISQRITLQNEMGRTPAIQSLIDIKDGSVEGGLRVRLTVQDTEAPDRSLQVYLDLSRTPYTHGLIPGATVHLLHVQRRVSVVRNVYCWSLPISCVTVTGLGSVKPRPPPPLVHLGTWTLARAEHSIVGQVTGHVVCVLFLRLQWVCSFCGSVYRQATCTRTSPPCDSTSAVFQAEAKVAIEDGTGEAQVWFSSETVAKLLLLAVPEWEGLQRHVRAKGHLRVYARARSMVCDTHPDDPLVRYLCCLCSSSTICRQVTLTCKLRSHKPENAQLRNMSRGDREFITKFPLPLHLNCTELHTHARSDTHTRAVTHTRAQ
ncbi:CST complex subunit CTC1 [Brachyhypopomus gauderio]|uniref:CST complex subunit CTC1 n=1 Tax=Brachyhypopomus gauderio TaxID=698409 RepID=UPI00404327BC